MDPMGNIPCSFFTTIREEFSSVKGRYTLPMIFLFKGENSLPTTPIPDVPGMSSRYVYWL